MAAKDTIEGQVVQRTHGKNPPLLVAFLLDPDSPQGQDGFIRKEKYRVYTQTGDLGWRSLGTKKLTKADGAVVGNECMIGVSANQNDLTISSVISFHHEPASKFHHESGPRSDRAFVESPFSGPNPRHSYTAESWPFEICHAGDVPKQNCFCIEESADDPSPENSEKYGPYFYPLLYIDDGKGNLSGEIFRNPGSYFYTVCVRIDNTRERADKFFIWDPKMEIGC